MPFTLIKEDITRMTTDAIVNAANSSLLGGGGVDGAIHRAAGPGLLEECRTLHGCVTGDAKITRGYNLPARYVIHTVGPIYEDGHHSERELLYSCYWKSLELAEEYGLESISFPLISAGAYGYPAQEAIQVATEAITKFIETHEMDVYLVLYGVRIKLMSMKVYRDLSRYLDENYIDDNPTFEKLAWDDLHGRRRGMRGMASEEIRFQQAFEPDEDEEEEEEEEVSDSGCYSLFQTVYPPVVEKNGKFEFNLDESFSEMLLRLIKESGMTETECYKKANIDRKLFSKIRSNKDYRPSKQTVCAFAFALELSVEEAKAMLESAGFALSHSSKFDCIIEYFLKEKCYDLVDVNSALYDYDQALLGSL